MYNSDGSVSAAEAINVASGTGFSQIILYSGGRITHVYDRFVNNGAYDTVMARYLGYNAAGQAILDSMAWDSSGAWSPYSRNLYTYDPSGHYLTRTYEHYDKGSASFVMSYRYINTYYPNGLLRTSL